MTKTIIEFMRHGAPEGGDRYRGHGVDDALSALGWQQMWAAVGTQRRWDRIVSSPLQRCREFALRLAQRDDIPVAVDDRFREVGFGAWEGKTHDEVRIGMRGDFQRFLQDPVCHRPPGAEPLREFRERVAQGMDALVQQHAGSTLLVVCHAGVIRAAISHVLQTPLSHMYHVKVKNAAVARVVRDTHGYVLESLG